MLTSLALAGALLGVAACSEEPSGGGDQEGAPAGPEEGAPEEGAPEDGGMLPGEDGEMPEAPEPDVSDVPDVVAEVNGEEITGEDFITTYELQFEQMAMQSQMTGEEVDEGQLQAQTLETMVGSELLVQDAQERGHEATGNDVDELLEETAEANGMGSVDELLLAYEEQGVAEEDLRSDAETQVMVNQLVGELDVAEPTEAELEELYEQMSAQQPPAEGEEGEEPPSFEEMRPDLEQQVTAQNENEAVLAHVDELREGAEVETFL